MKNVAIVLATAFVAGLIGGGWNLITKPDDLDSYFHRSVSTHEKIGAYTFVFMFGGGAAAVAGGLAATCILLAVKKRRKKPSPSQEL